MVRALAILVFVAFPRLLLAEAEPPVPSVSGGDGRSTVSVIPEGLPGADVLVAFVRGSPELTAGQAIASGATIELSAGGCIRLLVGGASTISFCGSARFRVEARSERSLFTIERGRGLVVSPGSGSIVLNGERLALASGAVYFDTNESPSATLLSGSIGTLGDRALDPRGDYGPAAELLSPWWCAPERPGLSVRLGDPATLVEQAELARNQGENQGSVDSAPEGGATCVDSSDSSSATDPNGADGGQIDPDVRRDRTGRLRLIVRIPRRN